VGLNISESSGNSYATSGGVDGWVFDVDLTDPTVVIVSGNFEMTDVNGAYIGDHVDGYSFSSLSTSAYGTLTYADTTTGEFIFTIDTAAVFASGADQSVTFTVTGGTDIGPDSDSVTINLMICVARGTLIRTRAGQVPVERLRPGDMVWTVDEGHQPLRWIGSRRLDADDLAQSPALRPVRIARHALGRGMPARDLVVSAQHRLLIRDWRAPVFFGEDEVLAPAKGLADGRTVSVEPGLEGIEYFHLMFDRHQIISTNGAMTESFQPGPTAMQEVDRPARREILSLFPDLATDAGGYGPAARRALSVAETRVLTTEPEHAAA